MSTVTEKILYGPAQPTTATAVLYTAPNPGKAIVKQIILANTTTSATSLTLGIGGTSAAVQIIPDTSISANDVRFFPVMIPLTSAQTINGLQPTAGAVTATITGFEIT